MTARRTSLRQRVFALHQHLQWLWKASRTTRTKWYLQYLERQKHERKVEAATRKMLADSLKPVNLSALTRAARKWWEARLAKGMTLDTAMVQALVSQQIANTLDVNPGEVQKALADTAGSGVMQAMENMGLPPDIDWSDPERMFQEFFPGMMEDSEKLLVNAAGDNANAVARAVVNAADPAKGVTIDQAVASVRSEVADLSKRKATQIARTETARTYGKTAFETMKRNGIKARRVLTAAKSPAAAISPVCSICMEAAGEGWTDLDSPFSHGENYPPFHPNCRCDIGANTRGWLPPKKSWPVSEMPKPEVPFADLPPIPSRLVSLPSVANQWTAGAYSDIQAAGAELLANPAMKLDSSGRAALRLLDAINKGPVYDEIYRGMVMSRNMANEMLGAYKPGARVNLDLSSFSAKEKVARAFADTTGFSPDTVAVNVVARNARGVDIASQLRPTDPFVGQAEVITAGDFRVVSAVLQEEIPSSAATHYIRTPPTLNVVLEQV